jgi:ketosteroid isomerase-like protein
MSEQNVELVRRSHEEWNRDRTVALDAFHEDVEFLPLRVATEGSYHGLAGIEAFVADTLEVFETFQLNYEYRDLGERVLAWGTIHVRAKASGLETDVESGGLFEFRDGKIVRWEDFGSKRQALEAAGINPPASG